MNKQTKIVFYGLIVIVGILAFSSSFLFAKLRKTPSKTPPSTSSATEKTVAAVSSTPEAKVSSAVNRAANATERPSDPTDTYTIQRGDSLMAIAQQNGLTMEELTLANGITDPDKILIGQILLIPKGNQINFTLDNTKAANLQKFVDNGKYPFRFSPEDTVRSDNLGAYGLAIGDNFTLQDKNLEKGEATVLVSKEGKKFVIKLTQPATRGEKGIWAIVSIAQSAN